MRRTRRLFFTLFGLTALIAVGSFWHQLAGLSGSDGIEPAAQYLTQLHADPTLGPLEAPTLLWLSSSDLALNALCALCVAAALALVFNRAHRPALVVLWACWLSLVTVCHPWLDFQWDLLLVEVAFVSFFFAPPGWFRPLEREEPTRAARSMLIWLSATLTLESGLVKLASGDAAWRDLSALTFHWWTQPLPTWSSVLLAQLPLFAQQVLCAAMFVLELLAPVLAFGPRRARLWSAFGSIALQLGLFASGNYSYYNLLALVLAVPLLDDAVFTSAAPATLIRWSRWPSWQAPLAVAFVLLSGFAFLHRLVPLPAALERTLEAVRPFGTFNAYGAFAVMTKQRTELLVEATKDGVTWAPYGFLAKPGPVDRRPGFVAPFQPRLDWQLWFAAFSTCQATPWVRAMERQLLRDSKSVEALFSSVPFEGRPLAVRTRAAAYRFAPFEQSGVWWTATELGPWCPPVTLGAHDSLVRFGGPP
jgi:hypothetical protein